MGWQNHDKIIVTMKPHDRTTNSNAPHKVFRISWQLGHYLLPLLVRVSPRPCLMTLPCSWKQCLVGAWIHDDQSTPFLQVCVSLAHKSFYNHSKIHLLLLQDILIGAKLTSGLSTCWQDNEHVYMHTRNQISETIRDFVIADTSTVLWQIIIPVTLLPRSLNLWNRARPVSQVNL